MSASMLTGCPVDLPRMPFQQDDILQIAPEYLDLQRNAPITRVCSPAGDPVWLVTRHEAVKALIADPRIGRAHRTPETAARVSESLLLGGPVGDFDTEQQVHDGVRRLLAPAFTARRTAQLREFVSAAAEQLVAELADGPQPADLHDRLALRLPLMVICTILGVPEADRARFERISRGIAEAADRATAGAALASLVGFMGELLVAKRSAPGDDLLTDLLATGDELGIPEPRLSFAAAGLLFAGHETVSSRIDFGALMLMTDPAVRRAVTGSDAERDAAVEEVLRLSTPNDLGQARYARTDLVFGGVRIQAGDALVLAIGAANRDPAVFADPLRFDPARNPNPHLTFGHGKHFCLGASLARLETGSTLATLANRMPGLRLAVPRSELRLRESQVTGGFQALPVLG